MMTDLIQTDKVIHQTMVYHLVLSSIINKKKNKALPPQSIHGRERYRERKVIEQYTFIGR